MFLWVLQTTLICILLIFLVHHLITFFKSTLTVPKIKDLVNAPAHKYNAMFNIISAPAPASASTSTSASSSSSTSIDDLSYKESLLPKKERKASFDTNDMKNELKNFMKTLL